MLEDVRSQPFGCFVRGKKDPAPDNGMISSHFDKIWTSVPTGKG